jgi:hypothetical protein
MYEVPAIEHEPIFLGREGEYKARRVKFDISSCLKACGDFGTAEIFYQRPIDPSPQRREIDISEGFAYWTVTEEDASVPGRGVVQLRYTVGSRVVLSPVWDTRVDSALAALPQ